VLIIRTDHIQ